MPQRALQTHRIRLRAILIPVLAVIAGELSLAGSLAAQTDFYNLDKGRPLRVEDAYSTKRWAFELQLSPLTLSQDGDGVLSYNPALELKYGILSGVEVSAGWGWRADRGAGMGGDHRSEADLSLLANLWVEGNLLPAAAFRVTTHLPTSGPESRSRTEVKGILTRSVAGPVRLHLNGALEFGDDAHGGWWAGGALDYVLPFHHALLLAETWVATPEEGERRLHSSAGFRYQVGPTLALDAGLGRSWQGAAREDWALTLGVTHEFGVRSLMPGGPQ